MKLVTEVLGGPQAETVKEESIERSQKKTKSKKK